MILPRCWPATQRSDVALVQVIRVGVIDRRVRFLGRLAGVCLFDEHCAKRRQITWGDDVNPSTPLSGCDQRCPETEFPQ